MLRSNIVRSICTPRGVFSCAIATLLFLQFLSPAAAAPGKGWSDSKYAAIVIDVNADRVLYARNADASRYPASLTKIMTLYMLFEQIERGRVSLATRMTVSQHAAAQAPSKLGLRAGESIDVRTAILALVTKSANDVAVVIAEHISGSESAFASAMTRKARELGMGDTTFRNASGLPDDGQKTTASDLAVLGRAIMRDFPDEYSYFKTRSFAFRGRYHRNHNRLLGRVEGVDGIKTGYIRASGFNLVTSARRGNRHLLAVVMGGPSASARDNHMAGLLANNFSRASNRQVAQLPANPPAPPRRPVREEEAGASKLAGTPLRPQETTSMTADGIAKVLARQDQGNQPAAGAIAEPAKPAVALTVIPKGYSAPVPVAAQDATASLPQTAPRSNRDSAAENAIADQLREQWLIQIGAYNDKQAAHSKLRQAQDKTSVLRNHLAYTEPVQKADSTLYRARFAGFDRGAAEAACRQLKKAKFSCLPMRQ